MPVRKLKAGKAGRTGTTYITVKAPKKKSSSTPKKKK